MHLRSIKLRGFKSFPDPVEVKLEPGVAVVVGPNGSGKSNVSDAIVWAAGSLTPSEMRAEKPDDVLFGGSATRQPADHCEVELLFDNEDGGFGAELDYSEIAIARRLVRGGEGQYLVNRSPVRRTDLVELLADVGLGGSMHSIVGQGKVDAVLASKPEDRRALVEEAAGLGKFKRRRHRAELKLGARRDAGRARPRRRGGGAQAPAPARAPGDGGGAGGEARGARSRACGRGSRGSTSRRSTPAAPRRTSAAPPPRSRGARRRSGSSRCSASGRAPRSSSRMPPARARPRSARSTASRAPASGLTVRGESVAGLAARLRDDLAEAELRRAGPHRRDAARARGCGPHAPPRRRVTRPRASGHATERARHAHALLAAAERAVADEADSRLEAVRREREAVDRGMSELTGGHGEANRSLVALGATRERLRARAETVAELARELRADHDLARAHARSGAPSPPELEQRANEARALARAAATERDDLAERARSARERLAALERSLAEREGVAPAARTLAAEGERLALAALEVEPGFEKAVAAALAWRASALLASSSEHALALLERARASGLGSLSVVIAGARGAAGSPPRSGARALPPSQRVPTMRFACSTASGSSSRASCARCASGIAVTTEGDGYDADRGELWFAGETGEAVLLELDARRRALADEADELAARAEGCRARGRRGIRAGGRGRGGVRRGRPPARGDPRRGAARAARRGRRGARRGDGPGGRDRRAHPGAARWPASPPTDRRSRELGDELRRLAGLEADARRDAGDAGRRASEAEVVLARLGGAPVGVGARRRAEPGGARHGGNQGAVRGGRGGRRIGRRRRRRAASRTPRSSSGRRAGAASMSISSAGSWVPRPGSERHSSAHPPSLRASRRPCARGWTQAPLAPESSVQSSAASAPPRSRCATRSTRRPSG